MRVQSVLTASIIGDSVMYTVAGEDDTGNERRA